MFIKNPEKLNKKNLFYCKDVKIKDYLWLEEGIPYISMEKDKDGRLLWLFQYTEEVKFLLDKYFNVASEGW